MPKVTVTSLSSYRDMSYSEHTDVDFTGTNLLGNGGSDWTSVPNGILTGYYDGTNWYCEVSAPSVFAGPAQFPRIGIGEAPDAIDPIEMTSSSTTSYNGIDFEPTGAMAASQVFRGFYLNGAALDPSGASAEIYGVRFDFTGVNQINDPTLEAIRVDMPTTYSGQEDRCAAEFTGNGILVEFIDNDKGQNAIHVEGGPIHNFLELPSTAFSNFEGYTASADVSSLAATSAYHALNVAVTGPTSGEVAAVGTHAGVSPVHQHTGTLVTPSQTEYAARWPDGGSWTDGIDGNQIFDDDDDTIYIGSVNKFTAMELILTIPSNKDVFAEFFFYDTSPGWVEFFPSDSTSGFQNDGAIEWDDATFTNWKSDYDPGGADGSAGYYIKVQRTRVVVATPPTPTTIKILDATTYEWDSDGNLNVNEMVSNTYNYAPDTASDDDYLIALPFTPVAYVEGMEIKFKAVTANTGACTVNANSLGAKSLKMLSDQDPPDSYIEAGTMVVAIYDGTNFQMLNEDANP